MRVAVIGAWHLGAVAAAVLAGWGRDVTVWDRDAAVRNGLAEGTPAVAEPGLAEALKSAEGRLHVQDGPTPNLADVDAILVAYDTPVGEDDRPDLSPVLEAVDHVAASAPRGALVILHSQIPVGTADHIRRTLDKTGRGDLLLAVTPENLRLGRALQDFEQPGFLTVGAQDPRAAEAATAFWAPAEAEIAVVDPATAELTKHVINAMLATSTALGNEVAGVADQSGADGMAAARLARRDPRLAMLPILPGLPFGGGTLARDLGVLADSAGQESLFAAVRRSNQARMDRLVDRVESAGGPVCFLGLTYKPGTSTLRRSTALELARRVAQRGHEVRAHDPHVRPDDEVLRRETQILVRTLADAVRRASTVVVATAHPEFRFLDPHQLADNGVLTVLDLVDGLDWSQDWSMLDLQGP